MREFKPYFKTFAGKWSADLLLAVFLGTMPAWADGYMREGGKAYHIDPNCPTLANYQVKEATPGLIPCKICCKEIVEKQEADRQFYENLQKTREANQQLQQNEAAARQFVPRYTPETKDLSKDPTYTQTCYTWHKMRIYERAGKHYAQDGTPLDHSPTYNNHTVYNYTGTTPYYYENGMKVVIVNREAISTFHHDLDI
ncbi:hypothetical protein IJT17_01530 [bacterium]|nr:hypothetical protein [bacterium]